MLASRAACTDFVFLINYYQAFPSGGIRYSWYLSGNADAEDWTIIMDGCKKLKSNLTLLKQSWIQITRVSEDYDRLYTSYVSLPTARDTCKLLLISWRTKISCSAHILRQTILYFPWEILFLANHWLGGWFRLGLECFLNVFILMGLQPWAPSRGRTG